MVSIIICMFFHYTTAESGVVTQEFIDSINRRQSHWTAGWNFPKGTTWEELGRSIGQHGDDKMDFEPQLDYFRKVVHHGPIAHLPKEFDARTKWPKCRSVMNRVRNQGNCSNCWAVSGASAMSDRTCIGSNGRVVFHYSSEDVSTCCRYCVARQKGNSIFDPCFSGFGGRTWQRWVDRGFVSGGEVGSKEGCKPYLQEMLALGKAPKCKEKCTNPAYKIPYGKDKRQGNVAYQIGSGVRNIQTEIYLHGPVQVRFQVFQDFQTYTNGVYIYEKGNHVVFHFAKLIGLGEEHDDPYWLGVNSWGTRWGTMGGFFKFLRGRDHCGIEEFIFAGKYKLPQGISRRKSRSCSCQIYPVHCYLFGFTSSCLIFSYFV